MEMKGEKADMIVRNACIVTMDGERRILYDSAIAVLGDRIAAIGSNEDILSRYYSDTVIDAEGKTVFPGFVNTHVHLFQILLKGLGRDKTLFDWLDSSVRRAVRRITPERIYAGILSGCVENLHSGVTTVMDYQYCHGFKDMDKSSVKAYRESGIRTVFGRSQTDVSTFPSDCMPPLQETNEMFLNEVEEWAEELKPDPKISLAIAPGIIWDITEKTYERCHEIAEKWNLTVTMHTDETEDDNKYAQEKYHMNTMAFLKSKGLLNKHFVAVHCVQLNPEEIDMLGELGVSVAHCPIANMLLASGTAPVQAMQKRNINISLGTDGAASNDTNDMIDTIRAAALIHKCVNRDASAVPAGEVLEMATINGARALGRENEIGSLETGKKADFFIYDPMRQCRAIPMLDPVTSIVYSGSSQNVETVVVGGEVLIKDGKYIKSDETRILKECQKASEGICRECGLGNTQWGQKVRIGETK